jgi:hypothetical protein
MSEGDVQGSEIKMVPALMGTWRLTEFADLHKDGKWQRR